MTRPKRFRDMSLTDDEVVAIIERDMYTRDGLLPGADVRAQCWRLYDRAKRLLPLWRRWGLENLQIDGYQGGYNDGHKAGHDQGYDQGYLDGYADGAET